MTASPSSDHDLRRTVIAAVAATIVAHADELTALDQAVGDGDHGLNMRRGFDAVGAEADALADMPWNEALAGIGKLLVMRVGGASGPLFGTLALTLGKELPAEPDEAALTQAFQKALSAVMARGKSEPGQKTMLDVLAPVAARLQEGGAGLLTDLPSLADEAAAATAPMRAIRGRASFLGERSIGHVDPGARSCALIIRAACGALAGPAPSTP